MNAGSQREKFRSEADALIEHFDWLIVKKRGKSRETAFSHVCDAFRVPTFCYNLSLNVNTEENHGKL